MKPGERIDTCRQWHRSSPASTSAARPSTTRFSTNTASSSSTASANIRPAASRAPTSASARSPTDSRWRPTGRASAGTKLVARGPRHAGPRQRPGRAQQAGLDELRPPDWAGYDIRAGLEARLGLPGDLPQRRQRGGPVGPRRRSSARRTRSTSVSAIIGTGLGGGVIIGGRVVTGRNGFGGELGHVLIPHTADPRHRGRRARVQLRPHGRPRVALFADGDPPHAPAPFPRAASRTSARGPRRSARRPSRSADCAERGDALCREIFRVQAQALGLFFDEMINVFDPDALIVGGGRGRDRRRVPPLVHRRDPRRHADAARGAGRHAHPCDAQRRFRGARGAALDAARWSANAGCDRSGHAIEDRQARQPVGLQPGSRNGSPAGAPSPRRAAGNRGASAGPWRAARRANRTSPRRRPARSRSAPCSPGTSHCRWPGRSASQSVSSISSRNVFA